MKVVPVPSGAINPENPPTLKPFSSSGALSSLTSVATVATDTAARADDVSVRLRVLMLVDGAGAAFAVDGVLGDEEVEAALAATVGAVEATVPPGAGSGSVTGETASIASSRVDICTAYPSAWSKLVDEAGPVTIAPIRYRLKRNTKPWPAVEAPPAAVPLDSKPIDSSPSNGTSRCLQPPASSASRVADIACTLTCPEAVRAAARRTSAVPLPPPRVKVASRLDDPSGRSWSDVLAG